MLMLALRLILKDKGGRQNCLPFVGSNLGIKILCTGVSRKYYAKPVCFLIVF